MSILKWLAFLPVIVVGMMYCCHVNPFRKWRE